MQRYYPQKFDISRPGFLSGLGRPRVRALKNTADTKADYAVVALPASPTASTLYQLTTGTTENTASYTTDGTPTRTELGLGLRDAIRNSPLYDLATPEVVGNNLVVTSRSETAFFSLGVGSAAALTIQNFNTSGVTPPLSFGVLVARKTTDDDDEARLPSANSDKIIGVAMSTYSSEKVGIGQAAKVAYVPGEAMDILDRCNDLDGIWVRCIDPDLTINEALYVQVGGNMAGWLTRVSTGNIALTNSSLVKGSVINSDGSFMALLSINLP